MREVNLSAVDLNLLPPLEALLRRRNVTHAAADTGLSQPAMSRALGRLRLLLADPLLVRRAGGFVLTPFAEALAGPLATAMGDLKGLFRRPAFDPRQEQRAVRLAAGDIHTVLLIPPLMRRLAARAPGIALKVEAYAPDLPARMTHGQLDLAFAVSGTPLPPGALSTPVGRDDLAVVFRRGHPAAGIAWTLADYARFDHVGVTLFGDGQSTTDALLAAGGFERRAALTTPSFIAALAAVGASDLITTVSRTLAERFADTFGLETRPPPFAETGYDMTLVWASHRAADDLLAWLRGLIGEVAAEVFAAP